MKRLFRKNIQKMTAILTCLAMLCSIVPPVFAAGPVVVSASVASVNLLGEVGKTINCIVTPAPAVAADKKTATVTFTPVSNVDADSVIMTKTDGTTLNGLEFSLDNRGKNGFVVKLDKNKPVTVPLGAKIGDLTIGGTADFTSAVIPVFYAADPVTIKADASTVNLPTGSTKLINCVLDTMPIVDKTVPIAVTGSNPTSIKITDKDGKGAITDLDFIVDKQGKASFLIALDQANLPPNVQSGTTLGTITIGVAPDKTAVIDVVYASDFTVTTPGMTVVNLEDEVLKTVTCRLDTQSATDMTVPISVKNDTDGYIVLTDMDGNALGNDLTFAAADQGAASFKVGLTDKFKKLTSEEKKPLKDSVLGQIELGTAGHLTTLPVKYTEGIASAVDTLTANVDRIYLAAGQNQSVSTWISPAADKKIDFKINGVYKNYIKVTGVSVIDGQKIAYSTKGSASFQVELDNGIESIADKPKDGDKLGEITIGGENCKPVTVSVYYAAQARPLTKIQFTEKSPMSLKVAKQYTFSPKLYPESATNFELVWASSDPAVLEVDQQGVVTAQSIGSATITVSAKNDPTVKAEMVVDVYAPMVETSGFIVTDDKTPPYHYQIDDKGMMETVQGVQELTVQLDPKPTEKIKWSISDQKVATLTVDETDSTKCTLKTLKAGTAIIKAKGTNSDFSRSFTIKVDDTGTTNLELQLDGNVVSNTTLEMAKGYQTKLVVETTPDNATDKTVVWKSSDSKVVSVSSQGVVKAKAAGTATIKVTLKSDMGHKDVDGNPIEPTIFAEVTINVREKAERVQAVKVYKATEDADGKYIRGAEYVDGEIDPTTGAFISAGNPGEANALTFKLGETQHLWVEPQVAAGQDFLMAQKIEWKILESGYATISQKAIPDEVNATLLTIKASSSRSKADTVRLVATNVGEYPVADTYPEIFLKLETEASSRIAITNTPLFVEIGKACKPIKIKTTPNNASNKVNWTITTVDTGSVVNQGVPVVDKDGSLILTGENAGKIRVTATAIDGGQTAEVELIVGTKVKTAKLNATSIMLGKGATAADDETFQLELSLIPFSLYAEDNVTYSSRDPYVATVDAAGLISLYENARIGESTTIDVMVGNQKKLSCRVKVVDKPPTTTGITVTAKKTDYTLAIGASQSLPYTYSNLSKDEQKKVTIKWDYVTVPATPPAVATPSEDVVFVDNLGKVTVRNNPPFGKAQIKATFTYQGNQIGEITYNITVKPSFGVAVNGGVAVEKPQEITGLAVGGTVELVGQVQPVGSGSNDSTFTVSSSYRKYLEVTPDATDKNKAVVKVIALPTGKNPVKAKVSVKNSETKKTVTVTIVLTPTP